MDGTFRNVVTWASWHSSNISYLLCGEAAYWGVPLVAAPAARREFSWQTLLSLSCAWKEEGGREYMNDNPGCKSWAELCCSSMFPLPPISCAWSSRVLLWVAGPCWGLRLICFRPRGAFSLKLQPEPLSTERWSILKGILWLLRKGLGLLAVGLKPLIYESLTAVISYINHMGSWSEVSKC